MKKVMFMLGTFLTGVVVASAETYDAITCGNVTIPLRIAELTSTIITILQFSVPIILIIMGMLDFVKAITSQKDDEIKKGLSTFIKRLIAGALVFLVIVIVKLVVGIAADSSDVDSMFKCIDCFTSNSCNGNVSSNSGSDNETDDKDDDSDDSKDEVTEADYEVDLFGDVMLFVEVYKESEEICVIVFEGESERNSACMSGADSFEVQVSGEEFNVTVDQTAFNAIVGSPETTVKASKNSNGDYILHH